MSVSVSVLAREMAAGDEELARWIDVELEKQYRRGHDAGRRAALEEVGIEAGREEPDATRRRRLRTEYRQAERADEPVPGDDRERERDDDMRRQDEHEIKAARAREACIGANNPPNDPATGADARQAEDEDEEPPRNPGAWD